MIRLAVCFLIGCLAFEQVSADDDKPNKTVPADVVTTAELAKIQLTDITGTAHQPFADVAIRSVGLVFVSTDCPIANSFQPELQQLFQQYQSKGIAIFLVYCSSSVSVDQVQKHRADYAIKIPTVIDSDQKIGRLTKAKVTPEAIVINRSGEVCYRGLINNLYAGYGRKRVKPTEHYLRDAFDSLLAETPIKTVTTKPIGCFIRYESSAPETHSRSTK